MGFKKITLILIVAALLLFPSCGVSPTAGETDTSGWQTGALPSVQSTSAAVLETTAVPSYDGTLQTLANGNSFYTPDATHAVTDDAHTVLYYNNLLLVFTTQDLTAGEMDVLSQGVGGQTMGVISGGIHAFQIMVQESTLTELQTLAEALMGNDQVLYACGEYPVQIMGTKADKNPWDPWEPGGAEDRGNEESPAGLDWWAEAIGAYTAWEYAHLCQDVRIGIADDGFFSEHEDLRGQIIFVSNNENNTAANHGTMVAGIIGAVNNDIGIRGVADTAALYCADLWPMDSPDSYHTLAEYLAVINYMAQSGVKVVNNSWGCLLPSKTSYLISKYGDAEHPHEEEEYSQWLDQRMNQDLIPTARFCIIMISQLISSGYEDMIHIQAAGNGFDSGGGGADARYLGFFASVTEEVYNNLDASLLGKLSDSGITYEAIDERILIVGAVHNQLDKQGNYLMTSWTNFGETVDICAPGEEVFSTMYYYGQSTYGASGGTSLAAPMVTGSVAYLWSLAPELTVTELRQLLLESAAVQAIGTGSSKGWEYPMLNIGAAAHAVMAGKDAVIP